MKLIRHRKPSVNTLLGITQAKRRIARATGIPTTKAGRKRKALNTLTGGAYGKYQRTRAKLTRPYRSLKHPASCLGCLIYIASPMLIAVIFLVFILQ